MEQMKIDFFIIGAPKCGTTAVDQYLSAHERIFMGTKEMHHFLTDHPDLYQHYQNPDNYFNDFQDAQSAQTIGESSVFYFYSDQAIKNILEHNPQAKIIVFLRNPIELIPSLHQQFIKTLYEQDPVLKRAFQDSKKRNLEGYLPVIQNNSWLLDYQDMGMLGKRLDSIKQIVPENQLHIIFYDDLKQNPRALYTDLLAFLGVPDDGREEFARYNARGTYRSKALASFLKHPPKFLKTIWHVVKPALNKVGLADLYDRMVKANQKEIKREKIDPCFQQNLKDHFTEDIKVIETITKRDLSHWYKNF